MIRKINFKQPKYIFPLVVFIPLCALVYFVMQTFGGSEDAQQTVATDRINTELPQANAAFPSASCVASAWQTGICTITY